jgi:uncharacterized membrane protein YdcZ (DUF606 family)
MNIYGALLFLAFMVGLLVFVVIHWLWFEQTRYKKMYTEAITYIFIKSLSAEFDDYLEVNTKNK